MIQHGLSQIWPILKENICWSIGSGTTIHCWEDPWILNIGSFENIVFFPNNLRLDQTLKDLVKEDDAWNIQAFREQIPEGVIRKIINIPPPHPHPHPHPQGGKDNISWSRSANGKFTIKSAYTLLKQNSWQGRSDHWKMIWRYQGLHRVHFFLWLAAQKKLFTNQEQVRRHIGHNLACPVWQCVIEDPLHVLRDCKEVAMVWKYYIPRE